MIESFDLLKRFEDYTAVDHVNAVIEDASVFGLIGTNGAGKSTFLRLAAGVLKPDQGVVMVDGADVYENEEVKKKIFFISDDQYFFANADATEMVSFYASIYEKFDKERFYKLLNQFSLDPKKKISTFSKGMKKQLSVLCGIASGTKYLFCDETFDGLDPVMRQAVKSLFAGEVEQRGMTPVIASHSLRELEDICDHVGLLHKGGVLFNKDLDDMKMNIHKIQCVLQNEEDAAAFSALNIMKREDRGRLITLTVRGNKEEAEAVIRNASPVFYELLPLSLEEIFISETEVVGYDVKNLIF